MFGGTFAPRGWAFCDGSLLPINQHSALFSILGTTYGGDGRTTFGLPDLRGRVAIHEGTGPGLENRRLGAKGGDEEHTLTTQQMPRHDHNTSVTTNCTTQAGTSDNPEDKYWASSKEGDLAYRANSGNQMASDAVEVSLSNAGGGQPHNNMQPFLVVNYIIALQGTFPSRA